MKAHHSLPLAKLIFLGLVNLSIYSVTYCQSLHRVNLLDKPDDWRTISLYGEFKYDWIQSSEAGQSSILVTESPADPHAIGAWSRPLEGIKEGKEYVIEARYHSYGFKDAAQHVQAILLKGGREFHELAPSGEPPEAGWYTLRYVLRAREDYQNLELRLYLHNAADTTVKWKDVTLHERTELSPLKTVHVGAISGRPENPESQKEAIDFYISRLQAAEGLDLDLVCLPENINIDLVPGERRDLAEPIPGETTRRLGEIAKAQNMYIVAGLSEISKGKLYNTAVLIGRNGQLLGKYRKTHLTLTENLVWGIIPGDSYPVFETDFGTVGLMVCYDNHFPEVARILAVKGAELLIMPNASDGRESGNLWEPYMITRALDNQVYMLSGVNFGKSIIVSPRGEILDINKRYTLEPGDIVHAWIQPGMTVSNWSGEPIDKRYMNLRRPHTYDELTYSSWQPTGTRTPEETARLRADEINHKILNARKLTADHPVEGIHDTIEVDSHKDLESALLSVAAGTEIIIKAGTVLQSLTLERSFPKQSPLLIRAEHVGQVSVNGPWKIKGSGYILKGLKWNHLRANLQIQASDVRVTRCSFIDTGNKEAGPNSVIDVFAEEGVTHRNIRIDRCEIVNFYQDAITVRPYGEIHEVMIDHNHIHHKFGSGKPRANGLAIYVGTVNEHREKYIRALVAYNFIHDLKDDNTIHLKSSGNFILFNEVTGQPELISKIDVRHGRDNVLAGNRIEIFGAIRTKDYNTIVLGNDAETVRVDSGNVEFSFKEMRHKPVMGYGTKPASRNTLLVGNTGQVQLGFEFEENLMSLDRERVPAANTVIYDHNGDVNVIRRNSFDWAGDWRDLRDLPGPDYLHVPEAIDLGPEDVGPES